MAQASLRFAKIVATPTDTAWSQAYNEGSVFTVLSLSKTQDIEPESLNTIGKEVLNIFRSEFFTLEEKSLAALKGVVRQSFEHVPDSVLISFVVAFNKNDLLYLLVVGGGKIIMKREGKTGVLLESVANEPDRSVTAASGILQSDDVIILQTQEFAEKMAPPTLLEALSLDLPNDIAEALTPKVHGSEQGASAAIILSYHGVPEAQDEGESEDNEQDDTPLTVPEAKPEEKKPPVEEPVSEDVSKREVTPDEDESEDDTSPTDETEPKKRFILPSLPFPRKTLLLVGIALLLVFLLIGSILATKKHQETTKSQAEFDAIYKDAKNDYDTGIGLLTLNKSLARDDFLSAHDTLKKAEGRFKAGTEEKKKLDELSGLIEKELSATSDAHSVRAKEDTNDALEKEKSTKSAVAVTEEDGTISVLTPKNVMVDDKELLADDWKQPVGIASYGGNIYILDAKDSIFKYVKSGSDYASSNYFKGSTPDLGKAVSLAIDGSVYVLTSEGIIVKYTKGVADSFKLTGLTTPFSSPKRIVASADLENIYVLDPKHSRIVVLEKTGTFVKEVSSTVLENALDLQVDKDGKTAFVLSGGKVYSLPLE